MWDDIRFAARDGVQLYARRYKAGGNRRPLLCLSGLVGNCQEFDALAVALSRNGPDSRTVYSLDCRGRGRSAFGGGQGGAALLTECEDVLDFMTLTGLDDAAILGTGHGGQLAMIAALLRPTAISALVLNDAAPEFEPEGVVRMMGEVAGFPLPANWPEAAAILKSMNLRRYPNLSDAQWLALAKLRFLDVDGVPRRAFGAAFAEAVLKNHSGRTRQSLWPQFAALRSVPTLLLRSELSDMVSLATVDRMRSLHPLLTSTSIRGEGHPALLNDPASCGLVAKFLLNNDRLDSRSDIPLRAVA